MMSIKMAKCLTPEDSEKEPINIYRSLLSAFIFELSMEGNDYWHAVNQFLFFNGHIKNIPDPKGNSFSIKYNDIDLGIINEAIAKCDAKLSKLTQNSMHYRIKILSIRGRLAYIRAQAKQQERLVKEYDIKNYIEDVATPCKDEVDALKYFEIAVDMAEERVPKDKVKRCTIKQSEIHGDIEMMWPKWDGYGDE